MCPDRNPQQPIEASPLVPRDLDHNSAGRATGPIDPVVACQRSILRNLWNLVFPNLLDSSAEGVS